MNEVSRRLLAPILERLRLMQRMVDRLSIDDSRGLMVGLLVREAEGNCLSCRNAAACRRWLDRNIEDGAQHSFCANAALFDVLPRGLA